MQADQIRKLVDEYIRVRTQRKKEQAQANATEEIEKKLKKQLIEISFAVQTKTLAGGKGIVQRKRKVKPTVRDWPALYAYIAEYNAWDLLQKRVGEKAVESRWEDDIDIPGIEEFPVDDLTVVGDAE